MHIVHIAVFSLCIVLGSSYLPPKTRPRFVTPSNELKLSPEAQRAGYKLLPGLRIPNPKFCNQMQLKPYRHYMVLPWWYNYCDRLMEKEEKRIQKNQLFMPVYGHVLKLLSEHKAKRRQMQNN